MITRYEDFEIAIIQHPVRLTLLYWQAGDTSKHSTLISFRDAGNLPTADLFPTYHQRQDAEVGIKNCIDKRL
jgi:hypothetical protein